MADETTIVSNNDGNIDISSIPNYIAIPNLRFGSGYLDTKYRNKAMKYEVMHDRVTGEQLFRRGSDGKFISFYQNFKYIHDMALELSILLANNNRANMPDDIESFYVNTNYDTDYILGNVHYDLVKNESMDFTKSMSTSEAFCIELSKSAVGFFIRPLARDTDRPIIEFLTAYFDRKYKNYSGNDVTAKSYKYRYEIESDWINSNATVYYDVDFVGDTTVRYATNKATNIRVGESVFVEVIPDGANITYPANMTHIKITIRSIKYDKIRIAFKELAAVTGIDNTTYRNFKKLIAPDETIEIRLVNTVHFIDNVTPLINSVSRDYVSLINTSYMRLAIEKVSKIKAGTSVTISETRPNDSIWGPLSHWGEIIRVVHRGGECTNVNKPTIDAVEEWLTPSAMIQLNFTRNESDASDILLKPLIEVTDMQVNFTEDPEDKEDILLDNQEG